MSARGWALALFLAACVPVRSGETDPGSPAAPLIASLESTDPYVRSRALQGLAQLGDRRAAPAVRELLKTEQAPLVQCRALQALGALGGPGAVQAVLPFLDSPHRSVRAFAAWAAGELRDPASLGLLLPLLSSEKDPDVLGFAVEALSKVGSARIQDRVLPLLSHADPRVRDAAAQTLGAVGDEAVVGDLFARLDGEDSLQVQSSLTGAVGRIGGGYAVGQLSYMLKNPRAPLRQRMAANAFKLMGERGVLALGAIIDDDTLEPGVRAFAARALGDTGSGLANSSLLRLLDAEESAPRAAALYALARTGDSRTAAELKRRDGELKPWMRDLAADALRRIQAREAAR